MSSDMIDQGSWYLSKIESLSNPDNPFSINKQGEYYYIKIGKHSYATSHFGLEVLMEAYCYILTSIRKEQGY